MLEWFNPLEFFDPTLIIITEETKTPTNPINLSFGHNQPESNSERIMSSRGSNYRVQQVAVVAPAPEEVN